VVWGVRRIREFNGALLGKWCWRVLVEKESLWYRVLVARYGEEGGRLLDGGRTASAWWRAIDALRSEAWFGTNVKRSVGNGKNIYFWSDVWVGGVSFKERFSRLFELSVDKWVLVFDLFHLGCGVNGEAWKWRRSMFAWEEEQLGELCFLLQNVILQVDKEDKWIWKLEKSNAYTVRSAYTCQSAQLPVVDPVELKLLWQKIVPLKVVVFVWHLLRNRLPTKDNLLRRGILHTDSCQCIAGCDSMKTVNHLFLHCSLFGTIWNCVRCWIGLSIAVPLNVSDHFSQFYFGGGRSQVQHTILNVVWFATVWEIWKERNNRIFNDKESSVMRIVDKIKSLSYSWLKEKFQISQLPWLVA